MKPNTLMALLLLTAAVSSCKGTYFYQVYKTESTTVNTKSNDAISYEDANCRIDYNLWANKGNAGFSFYNKTDQTINLLLNESFYVLNGNAYDYFQDRIFTTANNTAALQSLKSGAASRIGWLSAYSLTTTATVSGSSTSVAVNEARAIAIPPKTARRISEFDINQTLFRDCDLMLYPSARQVKAKTFSESETPLHFYNILSYRLGEKEARIKIRNDFYVSEITNVPQAEFLKASRSDFCGQKEAVNTFPEAAPDKFFLQYTRVNDDSRKH